MDKIQAINFMGTLLVNVDNDKLSDADFRQLFRNTVHIIEKPNIEDITNCESKGKIEKYYIS